MECFDAAQFSRAIFEISLFKVHNAYFFAFTSLLKSTQTIIGTPTPILSSEFVNKWFERWKQREAKVKVCRTLNKQASLNNHVMLRRRSEWVIFLN